MHIERHIFGSISGYATLARSAGLTDGECRQLESLSFGTPYEPSYQASLARQVAWWSRPLGTEKRAVSRVLPGRPDDAGRPTLLFVTAVVSADDWDYTLQGDVRALLRRAELWKWDGSIELPAVEVGGLEVGPLRLSRDSAARVLGLVSLVELSWGRRDPVVVREEHYSLDEVAVVERLLPAAIRREYSAVCRSLNPDLSASLNCLAEGVAAGGSQPVRRLDTPKSPYALRLASEGLAEGRTPEALLVGYESFGRPQIDTGGSHTEDHPVDVYTERSPIDDARSRTVQVTPVALVVLLLLIMLIGGVAGWIGRGLKKNPPPPLLATAPPWEELLLDVTNLPIQSRDAQLSTIAALQTRLAEPRYAEASATEGLTASLSDIHRTVRLARDAERAIAEVDTDKRASVNAARRALDMLAERAPQVADPLRDWLEARQRPAEDTLAAVSQRLQDQVTPQVEALEAQAERIDVLAIERARDLRVALNLLEAATTDRPLRWVSGHLSRLDRLIRDWERTLATLDQRQQQDTRQRESRATDDRARLAARLTALSETLNAGSSSLKDRQALGQVLQEVAQGGQASMGNVFSRPIGELAEWILALRDVAPPEHVEAIKLAVRNCGATARAVERAATRLSQDNTKEQNDKIVSDVRTEARTLALQLSRLEDLIKELEVGPRPPQGDSP